MPYYTKTRESLCVVDDQGKEYIIKSDDPNFERACGLAALKEWDDLRPLLSLGGRLSTWASEAGFAVQNNTIVYQDCSIPPLIAKKVLAMMANGTDYEPALRFFQRLNLNPSSRSVNQLQRFLDQAGIPWTEDGCFLAYKSVTRDYKDHYTRTLDNRVGVTQRVQRNRVSDDPKTACHFGLHVGALSYAQNFGNGGQRIVICKVDPEHVVCVPYDHTSQKMRVCQYTVVGNYGELIEDTVVETPKHTPQDALPPLGTEEVEEVEEVEDTTTTLTATEPEGLPDEDVWGYLRGVADADLIKQNLQHLRKYARHELSIVGASKLRGGKPVLVERILDVRSQD